MLPRQQRITRQQFPLILKTSRVWHDPFLSLRITWRDLKDGRKPAQFAFIVSNKVVAKAVDRNRLKRRARGIVRELLPRIKDNHGCLLFFKKEAIKLTYQELKTVIQEMFVRSSII